MSSLEKCLFSSLAHFLIGSFNFLELSCRGCLYVFEISCLSVASFTVCRHFDDDHSDWHEMIPHCGFDLHFFDNE